LHKRKLLIAEGSEELAAALGELFRGSCQVRLCSDGDSARQLLGLFQPDVLVLDLMLPGYDGLSLLQWLRDQPMRPQVLAVSRFFSDYVVEQTQALGVRYVMRKPCAVSALASQISGLLNYEAAQEPVRREHPADLHNHFAALGIRGRHHGSTYLHHAVPLYAADPLQSVTKVLYPEVAKRCGCKASHVERDIRNAILSAWKKRDENIWRLYFPADGTGTVKRPTNSEFIARMAQCLDKTGKITENIQMIPGNTEYIREE
jgi:two-component system response regulator (stage 0 sporulation protein A)